MSNSKYSVKELWNERYGNVDEITDYAGRKIKKSACGNHNSSYEPIIDHIRPLADGGKDVKGNIEICHYDTNFEKYHNFPHWKTNNRKFKAERVKGSKTNYRICED